MPKSLIHDAKLSPIEEYFYLVDQPRCPKTILVRMQLSGELNREAFEKSVIEIVTQHPLLRGTVAANRGLRWIDNPEWRPEIVWDCPLRENGFPALSCSSIRDEPGTRLWVATTDDRHTVFLQVHHCCADGIGIVQFTEELLAKYARYHADSNASSHDGKPFVDNSAYRKRAFQKRASPETPMWQYPLRFWRYPKRFRDYLRMFFRHPMALNENTSIADVADGPHAPKYMSGPQFLTYDFSPEESTELLAWCRSQSVTINSLLLQTLFITFENWRKRTNGETKSDLLRICMPVNLRTNDSKHMTIANSISFMLLDHQTGATTPASALKNIQNQVHSPDRDLRLSFNVLVRFARCFPGGVQSFLGSQNCWATAVFSNLGRVLDGWQQTTDDGRAIAGNVTLEDWELLPPLHDNVSLTVCSSSYAGKLKVLFYHDPNVLDESKARDIWERFFATLNDTVDFAQPPVTTG